jgi:hypothetical protein
LTAAQLGLRIQVLQPVEWGFLSHGAKVQPEEPMPKVKCLFFQLIFVGLEYNF